MARKKQKYFDEKEIIKELKPDTKKMIMKIYQDVEKKSFEYIQEFYRDYSPKIYKRLGAMPRIWVTPEISETDNGYKILFTYSDEGLNTQHGDDASNVFMGPFVQGYHGPPYGYGGLYEAPQMVPSPWERIFSYAKYKYGAEEI